MKTLFENITTVTMNDGQPVLKNAYVAVDGAKIASVGTVKPEGPFDRVIDGADKVLMPGLINAHTHIPMTPLRGYGGGHDLQTWLNEYIFPAEDHLDSRCIHAATALGLAELIQNGVTAFEDMYYFCNDMAEEVLAAGVNANLTRSVTCFQPIDDPAGFLSCREMRDAVERYHGAGDGLIQMDVSIHGEYTSFQADSLWDYLGQYAVDHKLGMHVHISETKSEHQDCLRRHGVTPLQILDQYGVWDCGRSIAAHCVWVSDEDMDLMARKNITCAHNPVSNLKLGSGVAPVPRMLEKGVNVAIATDGPSSNNNHDLFEELKLTSILHCGVRLDPMAITAWDALKMATVNGAKALGRKTGAIRPGYDADLILLDFSRPHLIPCHDVVENIVYAARGSDVCLTMARGKILYENGVFFTVDLDKIRYEMEHYVLPHMFP